MKQVLHLDGTDRNRHLKLGADGFLQGFPGDPDGFLIHQVHRDGYRRVFHCRSNGLNQQAVGLFLPDRAKIY